MRTRRLLLAAVLVVLTLFGGRGEPPVGCWEDDPCWDCRTMGNLVCGPVR
jgi:hypothetical protein